MRSIGALVLVVALCGCGGETPDGAATTGASTQVDLSGPEVTVSAGGDSVTSGGTLPEGFPDDAVRFPLGFEIGTAQERNIGGSTAWVVLGTVADPISPVRENLVTIYGEPDVETGDASFPNGAPVVMTWGDHEDHDVQFTLTRNDDGDTVVSALVKPLDL